MSKNNDPFYFPSNKRSADQRRSADDTSKKEKFPFLGIRAEINPSTIDKENRTVEVVFGTDKSIRRRKWSGPYDEQLSFDPSHVRMERMTSGRANLLDNHNYWSDVKGAILGVVVSAKIETGRGICTVKFSQREEVEGIWQDVQDGIIRNISVGYNVYSYEHTVNDDGPDHYKAVDWEPMEVSIVPIPADSDAYIRSATSEKAPAQFVNILNTKTYRSMEMKLADIQLAVRAAGLDAKFADELFGRGVNKDQMFEAIEAKKAEATDGQRSASSPISPEPPAPTAPVANTRTAAPSGDPIDVNEAITQRLNAERQRGIDIRAAVRAANLDESFADDLVARGLNIDAARKAILDKWAESGATTTRNGHGANLVGEDEVDKTRNAITDSILHRAGVALTDSEGKPTSDLPDASRKYRGLSMYDLGRLMLEQRGHSTEGLSRSEVAGMALTGRTRSGMQSTSDFPIVLGNAINRSLRAAYEVAPRTFTPFCRQVNHSDFRERTTTQISGLMGGLEEVKEGGEYKSDKQTEAKETWKVTKYGKKIGFTLEAMVNDDLSAFNRLPVAIAEAASDKQSEIVYNILLNNAAMGDGTALFHNNHGNLLTAAAIDHASLGEARKKMRNQKGLNKKTFLNLMAQFLIVGPDKELEAQQILNGVVHAATIATTNLFTGAYQLIVDPRITGNKWFMSATPGRVDTIEYGFLDGNQLYTEQRNGYDMDGVETKVRMIFGAKAIDWRGLLYNPGA